MYISALKKGTKPLATVGLAIRDMILHADFSEDFVKEISAAYKELGRRHKTALPHVAVRSSATAEDLPEASFAGQQESYLNISGIEDLLDSIRKCYASLFTDRAISYREEQNFDHTSIALSCGIQKMVRADKAGSGVMFTLDPESGFRNVIVINAAYGLGENVVQGTIMPDEYVVFKPLIGHKGVMPIIEKRKGLKQKKLIYSKDTRATTKNITTSDAERRSFVLTDEEILKLAKWGNLIEKHYKMPMDMEWAKDGLDNELYIVQARPETVQSQIKAGTFKTFKLKEKGTKLIEGLAIGEAIAVGKAQVIKDVHEIAQFKAGSILVTTTTSPDWVPIMKKAAGIITDQGGRTSHAAIVSRELGVPAIVGTGHATKILKKNPDITLSCAEGDIGIVYEGKLSFEQEEIDISNLPKTKTRIMTNIAAPDGAFHWWRLPSSGIGLARMEFIINNIIQIHPMALVHYKTLKDHKAKDQIAKLTEGFSDKKEYFVEHLSRSISKIAASQYPEPVIVRMSDFKTNEYANLIGGKEFEPKEENPMLGFRGASRYYNDKYREGFALECEAIKRARETIGLNNIIIMIPFCRTLEEADKVLAELAKNGLKRKQKGLQIFVMCEIPSNVILAAEFADRFDGFSIGSNDLTQLVLGVDRDSAELAGLFDERNMAVKKMIEEVIHVAHKKHCKVGICGQGPSDHADFAEFLSSCDIDSISLTPDSVIPTIMRMAEIEKKQKRKTKVIHMSNQAKPAMAKSAAPK